VGAVGLAVLAAVTFGSLLAEGRFDIARAPFAYLAPVALLLAATVVSRRRPTGALWLMGMCALGLLIAFVVTIIGEGVPDQWAVSLFVLVGTPVAAAVLVVAATGLIGR